MLCTIAIQSEATSTATGAYNQSAGGVLEIGASNPSSYGQLAVSGTGDFSASSVLHVSVDANHHFAKGDRLADMV